MVTQAEICYLQQLPVWTDASAVDSSPVSRIVCSKGAVPGADHAAC